MYFNDIRIIYTSYSKKLSILFNIIILVIWFYINYYIYQVYTTFISAPFCCQDFLCIQLYVSMLIVFYLNDFINAEPTQNERKFYILRNNIKDICKGVRIISNLFLWFASTNGFDNVIHINISKYIYRKIDTSSKIPRVNCRSACNILIPICTYLLMEFYCIKQCFMCSICSGAQARQRK